MFPPGAKVPGSTYYTEGAGEVFDLLAVGRNVRTFQVPWSRALYWHLNSPLSPGGGLVVPVSDANPARGGA